MPDSDPLQKVMTEINSAVENRFSNANYTEAYIAFIDILGMKCLLDRGYNDIRAIFNTAIASKELYSKISLAGSGPFIGPANVKMNIMSDAIVLSINANRDHSFSKLTGFTSYLIQQFLMVLPYPVFIRGGISKGDIYQDEMTVFGPGLVESFKIENQIAQSMRCVVSPSLADDSDFRDYISKNSHALEIDPKDGMYFVKFARSNNLSLLEKTALTVLSSEISDTVKSKYEWLLDYVLRVKGTIQSI